MKVKMKSSMAGANVMRNVGEVYNIPAEEAKRLINAGFAEPAGAKKKENAIGRLFSQREKAAK